MKRIGFSMLVVGLLAGCALGPEPKTALTNIPVETVSGANLGTHFCLKNSDGTARATFWGLEQSSWGAEEKGGPGQLTSCDVGPLAVQTGATDCPRRKNPLMLPTGTGQPSPYRLRVSPQGETAGVPQFQISILSSDTRNICGMPPPFTFAAHLVADENANMKFKWLVSNSDVLCQDVTSVSNPLEPSDNSSYEIYVYFADPPSALKSETGSKTPSTMPKSYRIEFFDAHADSCIKNAGLESRLVTGGTCPIETHARKRQEPVGDGRQHRAQQGTCDYASPLAGM